MNSVRDWGCLWVACLLVASAQATPIEALPTSWLQQAQHELQQREYRASATGNGLQAPNRAQGFRTYFNGDGVSLVARDAQAAPLLALRLLDHGRQQSRQATGAAEVVSEGASVTMRWPDVEARYDNRTDGLAQRLVLARRPLGEGALTLDFAIDGPSARRDGNAVTVTGAGQTVRWDRFAARDADGREISVALAAGVDRLTLTLDDRHARYPIAIDSMLGGVADAQLESNQAGAYFGASVAGAGDVNGDGFDDVIVGALNYDNGQVDEGAAFVYFGGPGAFDTSADAHLEMNQAMALFGRAVAGAGDVNGDGFDDVIVGASSYDGGQPFEGAAFIYFGVPAPSTWFPTRTWKRTGRTRNSDSASPVPAMSMAMASTTWSSARGPTAMASPRKVPPTSTSAVPAPSTLPPMRRSNRTRPWRKWA
jgi:hypothetical protein